MSVIEVRNAGPLIESSNYWQSEASRRGFFFLTPNDGVIRLLVPREHEQQFLRETWRATDVIVSRGPWPEAKGEGLEVLFEDGSQDPYSLHLPAALCVPLIAATDDGRAVPVTLWTYRRGKPHLAREYPGRFRVVPSLPWLKRWGDG